MIQLIFLLLFVPIVFRLIGAMTEPERLKEWEGKRIRKKLEQQFGAFVADQRMQRIGHRLGVASGIHGQFYRIDSPIINAAALPNGVIVVWKGLVDLIGDDDDQLASVLAHELGHLKHEHYIQRIYWVTLIQFVLGIIARPLLGVLGRKVGQRLILSGYSRFHERQADDAAWEMMAKSGMKQESMIKLFEKLPSNSVSMGFLGTHPEPKERAARLKEKLHSSVDTPQESVPLEETPEEIHSNVLRFPTDRK